MSSGIAQVSHQVCQFFCQFCLLVRVTIKRKGIAHPLQAMQAQRGLGELRLLDFLTSVLYGGRLKASRTGRLYP
jgi:hypothetical protein